MQIVNEHGSITYSIEDDEIIIDLVEVSEKRKGYGSQLVREVISIAASEEMDISLCAYPQDDSISLDDLIKFYERLEFDVDYDDGDCCLMKYSI